MALQGRIIMVTGAAGILGGAVVEHLAGAGAIVLAVDFAPAIADRGQAASYAGVDLTNADAVVELMRAVGERFGCLHGLANIAGGFTWETVADGTLDSWDRLYRMNVVTTLNASKAAAPLLERHGGAIVNVGAAATAKAAAGMGAYTASKSGVARLTEAMAEEEKDRGVRVNAVLPSIIDTPVNRADMPDAEHDRWVAPQSLAKVVGFLLSDDANAITGALVPVTGRV
ncbi:MAG: SDR family NAD(P)-dependent oxidoreductase [Novosphingobium sp.]